MKGQDLENANKQYATTSDSSIGFNSKYFTVTRRKQVSSTLVRVAIPN